MAGKELIALVAEAIIENPPKITRFKDMETLEFSEVVDHTPTAEAAISTILAALQEPTEGMIDVVPVPYRCGRDWRQDAKATYRAMLNASALGEQSDG